MEDQMNDSNNATNKACFDLVEALKQVKDPRMDRTRAHLLTDILFIGICSTICTAESFNDMELFGKARHDWFKRFLELPNGIPSHDTFNRVFQAIDPKQFMDCFVHWTQSLRKKGKQDVVAIDGKALRRAYNKQDSIPYIVSAWASENGLTLGQVKVNEKSNEITAIPELLQMLDLEGCIVTIDAMGCQKTIAKDIIEAEADYLLALKKNQGTAEAEVRAFFDELIPPNASLPPPRTHPHLDYHETVDGGHGRIETRRYWISKDITWFEDEDLWEGLRCFAMVESVREVNGESSYERRLYLGSIDANAQTFGRACRGHWGVENPLHWVLDVIFREDDSRARSGHAAQNLAALRRLALNLIKAESSQKKISLRGKRLQAGWNSDYLEKILGI
jgi:predicted transposase YbfD/YdcC